MADIVCLLKVHEDFWGFSYGAGCMDDLKVYRSGKYYAVRFHEDVFGSPGRAMMGGGLASIVTWWDTDADKFPRGRSVYSSAVASLTCFAPLVDGKPVVGGNMGSSIKDYWKPEYWTSEEAQNEVSGIRFDQQGKYLSENGQPGFGFRWFVEPIELDKNLEGTFEIRGPFGVTGEMSGKLEEVCQKLCDFVDLWDTQTPASRKVFAGYRSYQDLKTTLEQLVSRNPDFSFGGHSNVISTTQYQTWKVVALLKGLGFRLGRTEDGDDFYIDGPVEEVYDAWEPSKDGSRLTEWSDLSDPESPHFGRRYLTAYKFKTEEGHEDVIVWSSSPHTSEQLFEPVGLSSYEDWKRYVEEDDQPDQPGLVRWLKNNGISL